VRAVNEGLRQIEFSALAQVDCERFQNLHESALRHPLLHPAVARLIGGIFARQRLPRSAGPQNPEDSVEDTPGRYAWSSLAITPPRDFGDERLYNGPLLVGELHSDV
jgi:hypothetical protein